jgi:hypothetical protein
MALLLQDKNANIYGAGEGGSAAATATFAKVTGGIFPG